MKHMMERHDALKALSEGVTTHACSQLAEVEGLKKLLGKYRDTQKGLEKWVCLLKGKDVAAFVHHFQEVKRQISLLYPDLDHCTFIPFQELL